MSDRPDKPEHDDGPPVEDFASMLAAFEKEQGGGGAKGKTRGPKPGDTVRGRVVSIGGEFAFVDLGGKAEGSLDLTDVRDAEGRVTISVGDEIEAKVVSYEEGQLVLRRALGHGKQAHAELQQAFELGLPVDGLVAAVNKGGLEVQVAGARAFCPISQIDLRHVEDASVFVGQRLQFRITRYESAGRGRENIVLSRRVLLEEEQRARAEQTAQKIQVGAVLEGKVTTIKDYGAFVDLGGIEGMLHISEIGFTRVAHPKDVLAVGQSLTVQILKIEKSADPKRHDKISLSLKSLEKDPWGEASERFPEGRQLEGTVARVEVFGAFVEIAPGIEGLVHVSEMGGGARGGGVQARNLVRPGQKVQVRVISVDSDKKRISLSMTEAPEAAPSMDELPASVRGPAKSFGTFADLLKGGGKQKKK